MKKENYQAPLTKRQQLDKSNKYDIKDEVTKPPALHLSANAYSGSITAVHFLHLPVSR